MSELAEEPEVIEEAEVLEEPVEVEEPKESEEEEVLEITLGEESLTSEEEEAPAPDWVKDVRTQNRENKKTIRELKAKLDAQESKPAQKSQELRSRPTQEDNEWDDDKYAKDLDKWYEEKSLASSKADKYKLDNQKFYDDYAKGKLALKVSDKGKIEEYEENVIEALSIEQQDFILKSASNPALLTHALGNPKVADKLKDLAETKDPFKFIRKTIELELQMKTSTTKRTKPAPEKSLKGGSTPNGGTQKSYDAAIAKGDYTLAAQLKHKL